MNLLNTLTSTFHRVCILLLFVFYLVGCEKESIEENHNKGQVTDEINKNKPSSTYKYITGIDAPEIISVVQTKIKGIEAKNTFNSQVFLEVTNANGWKTYSMPIYKEDSSPNKLYNLVVKKSPDGLLQEPFMVEYETSIPISKITPDNYSDTQWKIKTNWLSHSKLIYKKRGSGLMATTIIPGDNPKEPCPYSGGGSPSTPPGVPGAGNGGGDIDDNDGGGGSGGGSGGGPTRYICTFTTTTINYSCNGPNSGTPHPSGPNSGSSGDNSCGDSSTGFGGTGTIVAVYINCEPVSESYVTVYVQEDTFYNGKAILSPCSLYKIQQDLLIKKKSKGLSLEETDLLDKVIGLLKGLDVSECSNLLQKKITTYATGEPVFPEEEKECPEAVPNDAGIFYLTAEADEILSFYSYIDNDKPSQSELNWIFNPKNNAELNKIIAYVNKNNKSTQAKAFAKWVIQFNAETLNPPNDYKKALETMAKGLRHLGGTEGVLLAEFIENVTKDINSMTVGEVKEFHALMKDTVKQFNAAMLVAIVNAYVQAAKPIIEYALFESGTTLTVKLLSKIPVSWVYRGARLEKMVKEVAKLGKAGTSSRIRMIPNSSYTKAKEFFNTLTKNAISIKRENLGNGKIRYIANMGNNNTITFRNFDHSGTQNLVGNIDLNFPSIWTRQRELKFIK